MTPRTIPLLLLAIAVSGYAQVDTATILGVVTDPSGAPLDGARVTASNDATGFSRSAVTSVDGSYLLPRMPIGNQYRILVEAQGFRSFLRSGIELQINQNARIDAQ